MASFQQRTQVNPPTPKDDSLKVYTGVIQGNLADLWALAHNHVPSASQQAAWSALTTDAERIQFLAALLGFH